MKGKWHIFFSAWCLAPKDRGNTILSHSTITLSQWHYCMKTLHITPMKQKSISSQCREVLPFILFVFQEKGQRRRNRGSRESKARERVAEKFWGAFPLVWDHLSKSKHDSQLPKSRIFLNHLLGNARWSRGQLEELPGQRQEEQGEKEQNLPEAPQSKDGAEGMMLWHRTEFTVTVTQKQALCIFTSASAGSFIVHFTHHQDTRHTADVLVPTLANVVLYSVFLMYIFVIHSQRSYLPRVRIEKNVSSTSVTDEKCG